MQTDENAGLFPRIGEILGAINNAVLFCWGYVNGYSSCGYNI